MVYNIKGTMHNHKYAKAEYDYTDYRMVTLIERRQVSEKMIIFADLSKISRNSIHFIRTQ